MKGHNRNQLSDAVKAAVLNTFSAEFQIEAIDTLSKYGNEEHERKSKRVQLAVVNLCGGNMAKLKELVKEAKKDYRNILYWNE